MKHILIVEDEFYLLESMVKFMNGLEGVRTVGCANLREALEAMARRVPDLVFSDINLPDGSGLELLNVLNDRGIQIPVIFVSAFISDYRDRIPVGSNIMVLEKPISMKRLRGIAQQKLEADGGDYVFKLSDYLQIAAMGGHTVRLQHGSEGTITMVNGALWAAQDAKGSGEAAFKRMVVAAEVHGVNHHLSCKRIDDQEMGARNIEGSLDNLLLNAVWEEEETQREESDQQEQVAQFGVIMDQALDHLLSKRYTEALTLFTQAQELAPEDHIVNTNIQRLNELGFYMDRGTA